jgi:hypothetical protein
VTPPAGGTVTAPGGPRDTLEQFLVAAESAKFEAAYRLLSSRLRGRYTPARLAEDFSQVKEQAHDNLARARLALASSPQVGERRAEFPIVEGKAVRLVLEDDGWKLESLE